MKKALLTCILLMPLLCNISLGQKVYFSDTSNYWVVSIGRNVDDMPVWGVDVLSIADSVVAYNGKDYSLLIHHGYNGYIEHIALLRDDTVGNVVYIKPFQTENEPLQATDTNEFVYMDYNLHVGDTLITPRTVYPIEDSVYYHIVTEVDSILMNGIWHKKFTMYAGSFFYEYTEGIGSMNGPIFSNGNGLAIGQSTLICFKNRDTIPYNLFSDCNPDPIAINELAFAETDFELYPNPASGSLRIRYAGQNTGTFQLKLTDMLGREKRAIAFNNDAAIDISALPPGIYFARILHNGILRQTKKLVVAGPGRY